jgi:hypothetical protein
LIVGGQTGGFTAGGVAECQAGTLSRRTSSRIVWKTRLKIGRKTGWRIRSGTGLRTGRMTGGRLYIVYNWHK